MGYISARMGDCLYAILVSLMALQLAIVYQNRFRPCLVTRTKWNIPIDIGMKSCISCHKSQKEQPLKKAVKN